MAEITFGKLNLKLCEEKAVLIPEMETLLCADIHLGKVTHFRKAGLAIPRELYKEDLRQLNDVIVKYHPKKIVILGDLFHSTYNAEWEEFKALVQTFNDITFTLIRGNHDTMFESRYAGFGLEVRQSLFIGEVLLTHEKEEDLPPGVYNIHGHIHPAVKLYGPSRQQLRLPCFHFSTAYGTLPAFGRFTGSHTIKPESGDRVFAVTEEGVVKV